jgi:MFS family permease
MNPFEPPASPIAEPPDAPGSPVKAVLLGVLVDLGGSLVSSFVLGVVYVMQVASSGVSEAEMAARLADMGNVGWVFAVGSAVGCGFSVLGGYVCARISRRRDYSLAAIVAACSAGFGALVSWGTMGALQLILLSAVTVACVLLGNRYGMVRPAR